MSIESPAAAGGPERSRCVRARACRSRRSPTGASTTRCTSRSTPRVTATGRSPPTTRWSLASRDGQLFSNERGGVFMFEMEEEMLAQQNMLMLMMDPPRHTRYRLLVSRAFTPRNIRALEEYIDRTATEIVDNVDRARRVRLRHRPRGRAAAAGDRRDDGRPAAGPEADLRLVEQDDRQRGPGVRDRRGRRRDRDDRAVRLQPRAGGRAPGRTRARTSSPR